MTQVYEHKYTQTNTNKHTDTDTQNTTATHICRPRRQHSGDSPPAQAPASLQTPCNWRRRCRRPPLSSHTLSAQADTQETIGRSVQKPDCTEPLRPCRSCSTGEQGSQRCLHRDKGTTPSACCNNSTNLAPAGLCVSERTHGGKLPTQANSLRLFAHDVKPSASRSEICSVHTSASANYGDARNCAARAAASTSCGVVLLTYMRPRAEAISRSIYSEPMT